MSVGLGVDAVHTSALFANDREHQIRLDPSLPGWWLICGILSVNAVPEDQ